MNIEKTRTFPKGLFHLFFTNAFFMVSLVSYNSLLVLYVTHRFHFPDSQAYSLYAAFFSLFFSSSLIGGYLGSNYSHKNTSIIGGLVATLGIFFTTVPSIHSLYFGLALYIIGSGCFVPNLMCAVSQLYKKGDSGRDSGFTMCYIGTNVGALITAAGAGYISRYLGMNVMFLVAAACMVISLIIYSLGFKQYDFQPKSSYMRQKDNKQTVPIILAISATAFVLNFLLNHQNASNFILIAAGAIAFIATFVVALFEREKARLKLFAFLFLLLISITFWSLYALAPSVLTIFIDRNVDRTIFGQVIPTASFYSLNPFFIITIGSFTTLLWLRLSKTGRDFSSATKFAIGTLLMGIGYVILLPAVDMANTIGLVGMGWIVLSYFLQTTGELFVGPIGFSMVGSLVPTRMEGTMMGVFRLSTGVAGAISGPLAQATSSAKVTLGPVKTDPIYAHAFFVYGCFTIGAAILLVILLPFINRLIRGEKKTVKNDQL